MRPVASSATPLPIQCAHAPCSSSAHSGLLTGVSPTAIHGTPERIAQTAVATRLRLGPVNRSTVGLAKLDPANTGRRRGMTHVRYSALAVGHDEQRNNGHSRTFAPKVRVTCAIIVRVDPPEHHLVEIRLNGRASYLLWVSGEDQDAVLADGEVAVAFPEPALALRYAAEQSLLVRSEVPTAFDLDEVAAWLRTDDVPDPVVVLNAWNICWDVATGTGRPFGHRSPDQDRVYDKLFWANNLPAVTPRE